MSAGTLLGRLAAAISRKGTPMLFTAVTRTSGPTPLINPPDVDADSLATDGGVVPGSTTLALRSASAQGVLLPGDKLMFGVGGSLGMATVTAAALSRPAGAPTPGFDAVPCTSVPILLADGTPVSVIARASFGASGIVGSYPDKLIDGTRILARDINVEVAAIGLPEPQAGWRLTFNGRNYIIIQAVPTYIRALAYKYDIQAR